jgi:hypothetical protein
MQPLETLEYSQLCHMAGITPEEANKHGITRHEIISILNQTQSR